MDDKYYIDKAADILTRCGITDDESEEVAYEVDISNPICPCCGRRLIIKDTVGDENEDLCTSQVHESYVNENNQQFIKIIDDYLNDAANSIINDYIEYCEQQGKEFDTNDLMYIRDRLILNVIRRRTIEIQSTLKTGYNLEVVKEEIEAELRKKIKFICKTNFAPRDQYGN